MGLSSGRELRAPAATLVNRHQFTDDQKELSQTMNYTQNTVCLNDNSRVKPGFRRVAKLDLSSLIGKWTNTNPATGGIAEIYVRQVDDALEIQVLGAPGLFDWGVRPATAYAYEVTGEIVAGFELTYEFEDQQALVTAIHNRGVLVIHTYHKFKDDDLRTNYICKEFFHQ
jgi:hypothetical protein